MKKSIKHTLIIGAGGSYPYGFPLGERLLENIKRNFSSHARDYVENVLNSSNPDMNINFTSANDFSKQIASITGLSIDKYLNLNTELIEIGKHAIATEILFNERNWKNPQDIQIGDDWYKYLFAKMLSGLDSVNDIVNKFGHNISIITFNYDRSLEHFLYSNLYEILKLKLGKDDISNIIASIPIIHVYGKTGYLGWESNIQEQLVIPFGSNEKHIIHQGKEISQMIEIIYEQRKDKPEIEKAKDIIDKSDRVLFLGFGYDSLNLKILDIKNTCKDKQIYGTALNSTENARIHIKNTLSYTSTARYKINIEDCDCLLLLRNYFIS
jgi:hypothetical protein